MPASVPLPVQQEFIRNIVVEVGVGNSKDSVWMGWYNLLKKYKEREGDCLVPDKHVEAGRRLGEWVSTQRRSLKSGGMTRGRKEMLDKIGFCWDPQEKAWRENYANLIAYRKKTGHCVLSRNELDDNNKLYNFVYKQRGDLKKGKLTTERKKMLDEIGFCWDVAEHVWDHNCKLLEQFFNREGYGDVPRRHVEDGNPIGDWLSKQRGKQKRGTLDKSREERLEKLGVTWNLKEMTNNMSWMNKFNLLEKFKGREGHCRVPRRHKEEGENLGEWLSDQKQAHKKGKLDPQRHQKLKELGVEW